MSLKAIQAALAHPQVDGRDKVVLIALADRTGDTGTCWPRIATIAEDTALPRRAVERSLKQLEDLGAIRRHPQAKADGRQIKNLYQLTFLQGDPVTHDGGDPVTHDGGLILEPKVKNPQPSSESGVGLGLLVDSKFTQWDHTMGAALKKALYDAKISKSKASAKSWVVTINRLRTIDKHPEELIEFVVSWYAVHGPDKYTPKARGPKEFRHKFEAILAAIDRNGGRPVEITDYARKHAAIVRDYITVPDSIELEQVLQRSINAHKAFVTACRDLGGFGTYVADHLYFEPFEWAVDQLNTTARDITSAEIIWSPRHPLVKGWGCQTSMEYAGTEDKWFKLIEEIGSEG